MKNKILNKIKIHPHRDEKIISIIRNEIIKWKKIKHHTISTYSLKHIIERLIEQKGQHQYVSEVNMVEALILEGFALRFHDLNDSEYYFKADAAISKKTLKTLP